MVLAPEEQYCLSDYHSSKLRDAFCLLQRLNLLFGDILPSTVIPDAKAIVMNILGLFLRSTDLSTDH
jgi:hypothetical protein